MPKSAASKSSFPAKKGTTPDKQQGDDQEVAAGFLLSLKHNRSVSPDELNDSTTGSIAGYNQPMNMFGYHHPMPPHPSFPPYPVYPMVHHQPQQPPAVASASSGKSKKGKASKSTTSKVSTDAGPVPTLSEVPFLHLIEDSELVQMKDRDLVPDALFVAMSQLKKCHLTQADRVGCYKARDIGFTGMCCVHCGGQPGFGRYFPNSVRSLAQTTTSQTVLKHIGSKCRFCPPEVRNAVLDLQRIQAVREGPGLAHGRPRYGSRKIFFQRVWSRLHGPEGNQHHDYDVASKSDETASLEEERSVSHNDTATTNNKEPSKDEHEGEEPHQETSSSKRKNRFGTLPMTTSNKKSKRVKVSEVVVPDIKA